MAYSFEAIPEDRRIILNTEKLVKNGYIVPCEVSFQIANSVGSWFRLVEAGKETDFFFGSAKINADGSMKIPSELKAYNRYLVMYEGDRVHIILDP